MRLGQELEHEVMEINVEIKHETIVICVVIFFLLIDLASIYALISMLFNQVSYQQTVLNGMINAYPSNALLYIQANQINQAVNIIIVMTVLVFLAYISKEPIALLRVIVEDKKEGKSQK